MSSTVGSVGGVSRSFTRTTTHLYQPDITSGEQWLLGRVQQTSVQSSVPDNLAELAASAGTAANAAATSGSAALRQVAVLTPTLAFGTVTQGLSKSLTLTLSNTGSSAATGLGYAFANPPGAVVRGSYAYAPGTSGWGTCPAAGGALAAGASCTVIVRYAADCTGGSNNGTLSISGANFTTLGVALTAATSSSGTCQ